MVIDVTGTELIPGNNGKDCPGNGEHIDENGDIIDCDYDSDGDLMMLGDIVISAERAAEQAAEYGHSFRREMAFLTVHSMLHLLGYDHVDDPEGERIMFGRQEEILREMGITRE